jgi:hypothetical protein
VGLGGSFRSSALASSTIAPRQLLLRQLLLHCSTTVLPAHMRCSTTVLPAHMHCSTTVPPVHMRRTTSGTPDRCIPAVVLTRLTYIPVGNIVKPPKTRVLPDILSVNEVERVINGTKELRYQNFILVAYSMGLRLGEVLNLKVGDIDAEC